MRVTLVCVEGGFAGDAFEHIQVHYHHALGQLLMAQHQQGYYAPIAGEPAYADRLDAHRHYQNAISYARAMVLSELPQTEFASKHKRYMDDPFARVMAAAIIYALPGRIGTDMQYANNQLKLALEAYREEAATLAGSDRFNYETDPHNQVFATLLHRHCRAYDPAGFARFVDACPPPAPIRLDPEAARHLDHPADLPPDHGMILVLHHAGFVAHRETLQIGIVHHKSRVPGTAVRFGVGSAAFWATGPGQDVVKAWGAFPVPDKLVDLLAPGGGSWIKFEIPVHDYDHPVPEPAVVEACSVAGGHRLRERLQVVSDLDAYARVTLKDEQPRILIRTLIRGLTKQAAVAAGAEATKKHGGKHAGLAAYGVNVLGSIAMSLTELADVRSANLLPDRIEALLIDAPAGAHDLVLHTALGTLELGRVRVPAGRLIVVPARTFE